RVAHAHARERQPYAHHERIGDEEAEEDEGGGEEEGGEETLALQPAGQSARMQLVRPRERRRETGGASRTPRDWLFHVLPVDLTPFRGRPLDTGFGLPSLNALGVHVDYHVLGVKLRRLAGGSARAPYDPRVLAPPLSTL